MQAILDDLSKIQWPIKPQVVGFLHSKYKLLQVAGAPPSSTPSRPNSPVDDTSFEQKDLGYASDHEVAKVSRDLMPK